MMTMTKTQWAFGLITVALLVAIVGMLLPKNVFGSTIGTCGGSVTCFTELNVTNLWTTGIIAQGGLTAATELQKSVSVGTCNTATSTAAIVANPFSATSTATIAIMQFGLNATSTSINIGTTTLASGLTSSNPGSTLASAALQATGTQATLVSGQTLGLGTGQISAGAGSVSKIVVGPSQSVGIFATSTYGNAGALNYTPSTCTYKISWDS